MKYTLQDVFSILDNINAFTGKVAYHSFPEESSPDLPFVVFIETSSDNFSADNKVYSKAKNIQIELYSENKDIQSEAFIEAALDDANIFYESSDTYLNDEKCYMRIYDITI